mgnify:CR=1 FL=1
MFDYLDYKGRDKNWLTGDEYSDTYKKLALRWKELPMYQNGVELKKLVAALKDPDVQLIVAKAGTGTGKTVLIPKVALKSEMEERTSRKMWRIAMTIPKSLSTKSAGEYAALTLDTDIGREVGYIYRDSDKLAYNRQKSRLTYMTDGYLLAMSQSDPNFSEYSIIIIDEAHERSKNIDFLMYKLRNAMQVRKGDLKVIIISATIKPKIFVDFFCPRISKSKSNSSAHSIYPPSSCSRTVVFSPKTSYPIQEVFMPPDANSNIDALNLALKNSMDANDVALVFVATSNEADKGCVEVTKACQTGILDKKCETLSCASLYSKLSNDDQKRAIGEVIDEETGKVYDPLLQHPYTNKIVFSTNIAESSITIDNLKVVIDSGEEFENRWEPLVHASILGKTPCTKAQILQRKGRVGRKQPGTVYYRYTKSDYEAREEYPTPNIHKADLTEDILKMLKNVRTVKNVLAELERFLTPPKIEQVHSSLNSLILNGMLNVDHESPIRGTKVIKDTKVLDTKNPFTLYDGTISYIGLLTLKFMEMLKVDMWNILILVPAFILYADGGEEGKNKNDKLSDIILLFCLLEELNQSPSNPFDAFFNIRSMQDTKALDYKSFILRKAKYDPTKEHASLISVFHHLEKVVQVMDSPFVNNRVVESVRMRYEHIHSLLMNTSFFKSKSFQQLRYNILNSSSSSSPIKENPIKQLKVSKTDSSKMTHIDKCVSYARSVHLCAPISTKNGSFKFRTVNTIEPLEGKFSDPKFNVGSAHCVYEKAVIMRRQKPDGSVSFDVNLKLLTCVAPHTTRKEETYSLLTI